MFAEKSCRMIEYDGAHWSMSRFSWFLANSWTRFTVVWWSQILSDCHKIAFLGFSVGMYVPKNFVLKNMFFGRRNFCSNIFEKTLGFPWFSIVFPLFSIDFQWKNNGKSRKIQCFFENVWTKISTTKKHIFSKQFFWDIHPHWKPQKYNLVAIRQNLWPPDYRKPCPRICQKSGKYLCFGTYSNGLHHMGTFLVKWDSFEHSSAPKHQNGKPISLQVIREQMGIFMKFLVIGH